MPALGTKLGAQLNWLATIGAGMFRTQGLAAIRAKFAGAGGLTAMWTRRHNGLLELVG